MRTDIEIKHKHRVEENEGDSVRVVDRVPPLSKLSAVQFVYLETSIAPVIVSKKTHARDGFFLDVRR